MGVKVNKCICGGELKISPSPNSKSWYHGQCTGCEHHQQGDSPFKIIDQWNWMIDNANEKNISGDRWRSLVRLWNDR